MKEHAGTDAASFNHYQVRLTVRRLKRVGRIL
jgi:hypothetical protein